MDVQSDVNMQSPLGSASTMSTMSMKGGLNVNVVHVGGGAKEKGKAKEKAPPLPRYEACNSCRLRKVRCDGKFPCGACVRSQNSKRGSSLAQTCEYDAGRQRKPKYVISNGNNRHPHDELEHNPPNEHNTSLPLSQARRENGTREDGSTDGTGDSPSNANARWTVPTGVPDPGQTRGWEGGDVRLAGKKRKRVEEWYGHADREAEGEGEGEEGGNENGEVLALGMRLAFEALKSGNSDQPQQQQAQPTTRTPPPVLPYDPSTDKGAYTHLFPTMRNDRDRGSKGAVEAEQGQRKEDVNWSNISFSFPALPSPPPPSQPSSFPYLSTHTSNPSTNATPPLPHTERAYEQVLLPFPTPPGSTPTPPPTSQPPSHPAASSSAPTQHFPSAIPLLSSPPNRSVRRTQNPWPTCLPPREVTIPLVFAAYGKCIVLADILYPPTFISGVVTQWYEREKGEKPFYPLVLAVCLVGLYGLKEEEIAEMVRRAGGRWWEVDGGEVEMENEGIVGMERSSDAQMGIDQSFV
ncbi:hypothetical protein BT69DRAFT_80998 [Atractiella rhizophila]|nr:hypothetical protein BT69DRAFT_80998 [Atractiella rhizophila]